MICFAALFSANGQLTWTAPEDCTLVGASLGPQSANVLISANPTLDASQVIVGHAGIIDHLICFLSSANTSGQGFIPFLWEAKQGDSVYISADNAAYVAVYYQPQLT